MDTSWKSWVLTIGSATLATLIALGHEAIVMNIAGNVAATALWILTADVL